MSEKKTWVKRGGGTFRLINGRIIKPTEVFSATEEEIPLAFRDTVQLYTGRTAIGQAVRKEEKIDPDESLISVYRKEPHPDGEGYNIVNQKGKILNENVLSVDEADKMLESLS